MDWTKVWSKKYPILEQYTEKENIEKYNEKIRNIIEEIKNEYGFNNEDAMLVIKDILYKEYLKTK